MALNKQGKDWYSNLTSDQQRAITEGNKKMFANMPLLSKPAKQLAEERRFDHTDKVTGQKERAAKGGTTSTITEAKKKKTLLFKEPSKASNASGGVAKEGAAVGALAAENKPLLSSDKEKKKKNLLGS